MIRILTPEPGPSGSFGKASPSEEALAGSDVEYVLGRRQMASIGFLAAVLITITAGTSYMVGRAAGASPQDMRQAAPPPLVVSSIARPMTAPQAVAQPVPAQPAKPAPVPVASPSSTPAPLEVSAVKPSEPMDPALVGQIVPGSRYLQVGAVERPVAVILTESLRSRGLQGFVAAGPTNGVYRVLVGPLPDDAQYAAAKATVDKMGIPTFTRQ